METNDDKLHVAMQKSMSALYDFMENEDVPDDVADGFNCLTQLMDANAVIIAKTQKLVHHFSSIIEYFEDRVQEELAFANKKSVHELDDVIKSGLLLTMIASISASKYEITKECSDINNTVEDFVMLKNIENNI